jgi:hypothetical protein
MSNDGAITTIDQLKQAAPPALKPAEAAALAATEIGFFSGPAFALAHRVAQVFAQSTLVPKHYQGNPGNCMIALNMAQRLGCDPLMAMQNLYVVHGTPAWSAQFLIATFNKCGRFSAIRYEFQGAEGTDSWGCRAMATEQASGEKLTGPLVTIALAKKEGWHDKNGSKWQTMPEQMLRYRAAAWFVRAYAPEIAMGLHMAEEILDAKPNEFGSYESTGPATITIETIKNEAQEPAPAKPETPDLSQGPAKRAQTKAESKAQAETPPAGNGQTAEAAPKEPPATTAAAPAKDNSIERVSATCYDICKNRNLPMDDMLAQMFPDKAKGKLTLEDWDKFYRSLI